MPGIFSSSTPRNSLPSCPLAPVIRIFIKDCFPKSVAKLRIFLRITKFGNNHFGPPCGLFLAVEYRVETTPDRDGEHGVVHEIERAGNAADESAGNAVAGSVGFDLFNHVLPAYFDTHKGEHTLEADFVEGVTPPLAIVFHRLRRS